jgi:LysM repeat protein
MERNFMKSHELQATSYRLQVKDCRPVRNSQLPTNGWKLILSLAVCFLAITNSLQLAARSLHLADSLRIETINGKQFIIHQVDQKETLYSISKRYGVAVASLIENNPNSDAGLSVGQELKVPYIPKGKPEKDIATHKVEAKETLFSISKIYNISVDDLKNWNNLNDNSLSVGQELIVQKKTANKETMKIPDAKKLRGVHAVMENETLFSISKMYGTTIDQLKSWNKLTTNEVKPGQTLFVLPPMSIPEKSQPNVVSTEPVKPSNPETKISETVAGTDEIHEKGLAGLIEGTDGNRKYLAQHKIAKVGTIMKVRNEVTKREVFVKVVGPLVADDGSLIKISKSAFDKLGATDPKFNVELIYYK